MMSAMIELENGLANTVGGETDLYRLFAYVLAPPAEERYAALQSRKFGKTLRALWEELNPANPFPGITRFKSREACASAYIALFDVGVPEPPVPLVESAHHKSIPAQQIALENVSFYEVLGLQADLGRTVPDHLLTQLEFLSAVRYAAENTTDAENGSGLQRLERDFLQRHLLNWLPTAHKKLEQLNPPLFPLLFSLLSAFLSRRFAALSLAPERS